jgi:hypothetical protein
VSDEVTVSVAIDGGLAPFPGLSRPVTVSTADLSPEDADRVAKLVADERLFDIPRDPPPPDARSYTVTVASGGTDRTVIAFDPVPAPLRDLIDVVRRHRRST